MQVNAFSKSVKISPRKIQLVAETIRNSSATDAVNALSTINKRAAQVISKILKSAISNAVNNNKLSEQALIIKAIDVTVGPAMKRFRPSTRGRVHPYKKRSSHIRIVLEERGSK